MADWNNPKVTSNYKDVIDELKSRDDDLATMFDGNLSTNIPDKSIKWDSGSGRWKRWVNSAWQDLSSIFRFTSILVDGNISAGGDVSIGGSINAKSITVGSDPTSSDSVATKGYVDSSVGNVGSIAVLKANNLSDIADKNAARTALGAPSTAGSGASGTWNIAISGNAATASYASSAGKADKADEADYAAKAARADSAATADNGGVTSVNGQKGNVTVKSPYVGGRGQVFKSTGTFTIPDDVTAVKVTLIGGGGGGGGAQNDYGYIGGGGGGAGSSVKYLTNLTPGSTINVAVGSGGTGTNFNGNSGGNSFITSGSQAISEVSANGGGGGGGSNQDTQGYAGSAGVGSGGDVNMSGSWGGLGGGSNNSGGNSTHGGGARAYTSKDMFNGFDGGALGGGGGGGKGRPGGRGADGAVIFEW